MSREDRRIVLVAGLVCALLWLAACAPAVQDASRARSEYVAERGATIAAQDYASEAALLRGIMPPEQVRINEYLNYYDQSLPAPPEGQALGLSATLGNTFVPDGGGVVWLQVGLQAAAVSDPQEDLRRLNLALVLDKSGSMASADKMSYLKQSLRLFVAGLHPEDLLAIVAYDDEAQVVLPTQAVGDGQAALSAIESLRPGGATNLHAGLMLGYAEVERYFDPRLNNRVILMTDGIANRGVTDPDQIAAESKAYNEKGIYLSTIGLGFEFNDKLLSTLARQGKGNYHFVGDAKDMQRVFQQEAAGLVQTVGTNVWLTAELPDGAQVQRVYGYGYNLQDGQLRVQFDDAGSGTTQVLVIKMVVPAKGEEGERVLADLLLSYQDPVSGVEITRTGSVPISYGAPAPYDALVSPRVRRNAAILRMAETLQEVGFLVQQRQYQQALDLVREVKPEVWRVATEEGDEQFREDVKILDHYEATLTRLVELGERPAPDSRQIPQPQRPGVVVCGSPAAAALAPALVGLVTIGRRGHASRNAGRRPRR